MEKQQLLTQCQILQHEVLAGSKCANKPADEVPKQRNHGKNLSGKLVSDFVPSHSFRGPTEFWRTTSDFAVSNRIWWWQFHHVAGGK